jgi:ornithine--oxo-acid transaminase
MPSVSAVSIGGIGYSAHVNPQWVRLLSLLEMNVQYERCLGSELFTADGRRILDFLSGYCVHNIGHNHAAVLAALREELERCGPAMIQTHVAESAGELGEALCRRSGGGLTKVFFGSSGSEGVEAAIKFARAATGRTSLLSCGGAFHGLTCGAISLMDDRFWRDGFGPMLTETVSIPFNDADALEQQLATKRFAAFFVEPIQSEAGIRVASEEYLGKAELLCKRYGSLLVLDEVQTGLHRTGEFLCAQRYGVEPDIVILARALSGGLVPVSAVLMTEAIYEAVYGSLRRAIVHTSTFSENALAMRAGLATLRVLEEERLGERAAAKGRELKQQLQDALADFEMIKGVVGEGLLLGVEFQVPRQLRLRVPFEAFQRIHSATFGQIVVMRMFRDYGMLTQICGNNFSVLKVAPPLVVTDEQAEEFVAAIRAVVELMHTSTSFWSEALGLAKRAAGI